MIAWHIGHVEGIYHKRSLILAKYVLMHFTKHFSIGCFNVKDLASYTD
jgi:hypothetical protein